MSKPFVIGIAGGTCSQKSLFAKILQQLLKEKQKSVLMIELNNFYIQNTGKNRYNIDFDNPSSLDFQKFEEILNKCIESQNCLMPNYNKQTGQIKYSELIFQDLQFDVIIIEGLLTLYSENILKYLDLKIFLDTDDDIRLSRRDVIQQNMDIELVLNQYSQYVKPGYNNYVYPSKRKADIIILNYGGGYTKQNNIIDDKAKIDLTKIEFDQFDHKAIEMIVNQICYKR